MRALAEAGDGRRALALFVETWRDAWFNPGDLAGGSAAAAAALAAPGAETASADRARVLYADHLFAFRAGDQERARARAEECLAVARAAGDVRGECDGLTGLARVALRDGDYGQVVELARQARTRAQAAGDGAAEASPLHLEAVGLRLGGDLREARELYLQSLELGRERDDQGMVANELHNLGWVDLHLGDLDAAEARFRDFAEAAHAAHHRPWVTLDRAAIAAERGDLDAARALLAEGEALIEEARLALDPDDRFELEWLRARVGDEGAGPGIFELLLRSRADPSLKPRSGPRPRPPS